MDWNVKWTINLNHKSTHHMIPFMCMTTTAFLQRYQYPPAGTQTDHKVKHDTDDEYVKSIQNQSILQTVHHLF